MKDAAVLAEIQGLYGAFSFPEKLLQKIWLRGNFQRAGALLSDGRPVRIAHPGKWNLIGGPDFRGARLRFGEGPEVTGDVEVHLRASDWDAHAHAADPAYARVVLHVVLFPVAPGETTRGAGGGEIPILALLPLLHHDLEEFAAEDAVETLASRTAARLPEELGTLAQVELLALLRRHALARWDQKRRFAHLRVQRLGWESACHHAALEVLGYRYNRAAMLRLAGAWPLAEWTAQRVRPEELFDSEREGWSLQGVRPANHPRARLRQYAAWTAARPDWPERLARCAASLPTLEPAAATRDERRRGRLAAWRDRLADELAADALGGTRFDNLICDGLLPLLAAQHRTEAGMWFHWFPGDLPPLITRGLRELGVFDGRAQPVCHGFAQGLLGWLIERDAQR